MRYLKSYVYDRYYVYRSERRDFWMQVRRKTPVSAFFWIQEDVDPQKSG